MDFICYKCGHKEDWSTSQAYCQCGGLWTIDYHPGAMDFASLDRAKWSIFRYRPYMALAGQAWQDISLGEGLTPIIEYSQDLLLKLDFLMPTLSYKDRGAAALMAHAKALGIDKVIQDSSGNAGNSIAAYAARAGIGCEILVPQGTSPKKIAMIRAHKATCTIVPGDRDHTARLTKKRVQEEGLYYASHVYNPIFYQGTKTYIYEVFDQLGYIPQTLVLPIGNGTIFLGAVFGLEDLIQAGLIETMPHIIGVQSSCADPIYQAYSKNMDTVQPVQARPTLAEGIAIGQPARGDQILSYIKKYKMEVILAPEDQILGAKADLASQGLYVEDTTAAIYAAYQAYTDKKGPRPGKTLLTLTGAGLKST